MRSPAVSNKVVLANAVVPLETITLSELGDRSLLDRIDAKFVVPTGLLAELVARGGEGYRVLEVNGRRLHDYRTLYFDTADLAFYRAAHAGRLPRRKVRVRSYRDVGQPFLEVKTRTNTGRTVKLRSVVTDPAAPLAGLRSPPFAELDDLDPDRLGPVVRLGYTRVTLVHRDEAERVTIDVDVSCSNDCAVEAFEGLVVVEIKRQANGYSSFRAAIRDFGLRPGAVSKYCLGVAALVAGAKANRFKADLARMQRIIGNHAAH